MRLRVHKAQAHNHVRASQRDHVCSFYSSLNVFFVRSTIHQTRVVKSVALKFPVPLVVARPAYKMFVLAVANAGTQIRRGHEALQMPSSR